MKAVKAQLPSAASNQLAKRRRAAAECPAPSRIGWIARLWAGSCAPGAVMQLLE
jgi:hypothetical protein